MRKLGLVILLVFFCTMAQAKEIALTFDDVPFQSTPHFETIERTNALIQKLNDLKIPPVFIFANPCKREDTASVLMQLGKYKNRGDIIGNHTCTHPRLNKIGFAAFSQDASKADLLLKPLLTDQKFFRFPFLNEGNDPEVRDKMRAWLQENGYRNGMVSADNEDPLFSFKINQAKKLGKKINYEKVKKLFLDHILTSLACDDKLASKTLGYSPKHVINRAGLSHEAFRSGF